jgi:hypothetical protein
MPNLIDEVTSLPSLKDYSEQDRYREFRRVFLDTDGGPRVLAEILSWGRLFKQSVVASPVDANLLLIREGQRNMTIALLNTIYNEPSQKPTKQKR